MSTRPISKQHRKKLIAGQIAWLERTFADRFWARVNKNAPNGCWEWTATKMVGKLNYGLVYHGGHILTHRMAWTLLRGPIPHGLCVLHRCDNPPCCNPDHLFLGTRTDNSEDCRKKGRHRNGSKGKFGEAAMHVKLKERQVIEIIKRQKEGPVSNKILAKEYGVSPTTIYDLLHGVSWPHVPR